MEYRLARCCTPREPDRIVGFLKQDEGVFSVHQADCANLRKIPAGRLVTLGWTEVRTGAGSLPVSPDQLIRQLDDLDREVLCHHSQLGPDYAAAVAYCTRIPAAEVFARHRKLRDLGLLRRVEPRMIQYRKGIVDGKWVKHRNHTYYEITELGRVMLHQSLGEGQK